jgi:transposase
MERGKKSRRARLTREFKLEAVRLLEVGETPVTELALQLGVERSQLYKWQKALQAKGDEGAFRGPGAVPLNERTEIERLKHELAKVKEERDILKKAAAYFAKDLP